MLNAELYLNIPGYEKIYVTSAEDITEILNEVDEQDAKFSTINLVVADTNNNMIAEDIVPSFKDTNEVKLKYNVPKQIVFTQKFQDRIKKEIPSVIESVYPEQYDIIDISYNTVTNDNVELSIYIKAKTENASQNLKYLDENIGYTVNNIIDYYNK